MSVTELNLACCAVEAAEGVHLWRVKPEFVAAALAVEPTTRTWSDVQGRKVQATFQGIDGQFITSRMPGDLHRHLSGIVEALGKTYKKEAPQAVRPAA